MMETALAVIRPAQGITLKMLRTLGVFRSAFAASAYRLFYAVYYRFLYGRKFRLAAAAAPVIARLEQRQARGDVAAGREKWEAQYLQGRWQRLGNLEQVPRYSVVAGYVQFLKPSTSVLDVGCGEGLLLQRLGGGACARYVGIDLSQAAIDKAASRATPGSAFVRTEAQEFAPGEKFDAIVFNEVLYYFANPFAVVKRYEAWLKPGGIFIASLVAGSARAAAIGRWLKKTYTTVAETKISVGVKAWTVYVFAPGAPRPRRHWFRNCASSANLSKG